MLKFILGFVIGTLFGWKLLSWIVPIILNKLGG